MKTNETITFSKEELEKEEWRDVLGYDGIYQVSNLGRIKSLDRYIAHSKCGYLYKRGKIFNPSYNKSNGYLVRLVDEFGRGNSRSLSHIIAENFIENPYNFECVRHKDGNRRNNRISNLEWYSMLECRSKAIKKIKSSKFSGVSFDKIRNRWVATFRTQRLGYFKTEQESYQKRKNYCLINNIEFNHLWE